MSTGNFKQFKANYIYVPKNCSEEPTEIEIELVEDEIANFIKDLENKLLDYTYKGYTISMFDKEEWKYRDAEIIQNIVIEGYNDKEEYIEFEIQIIKAIGYYWGANIDYDYDEHKLSYYDDEKDFMKVFLHIIQVLENTLYDHFDRYSVIGRTSSGETFYRKLKNKR